MTKKQPPLLLSTAKKNQFLRYAIEVAVWQWNFKNQIQLFVSIIGNHIP